ncbi:predicted protein [Aspergillus terreus NIH2624]|uniref:Uncharacterized protein n=1 Tax=Aspergillus terreus (strain NIH 2624 / FGSC A1156) TaxID=341663 RepID=Q0C7V3_ASPTN|nr:uncharacterized protein ATEG_10231 [Aspergillus terreus NIH2624]EAU29228.1 predicted protein [Aspergillus terreus NIH2624]
MDKFNPSFKTDKFQLFKTWEYKDAVFYRMATRTSTIAYIASWFSDVKVTVVFLKIQLPTFTEAYDALEAAGQKIALWETISGWDIMHLCRTQPDKVQIDVNEVGHERIFMIAWAPQSGDKATLEGMQEFINENYALQLAHDHFEGAIRRKISSD